MLLSVAKVNENALNTINLGIHDIVCSTIQVPGTSDMSSTRSTRVRHE